ncbi:unnamed protein product [Citrullus colocynthis]|uniref:Subtilisin-like protease fibronectin type-III domain-containing protein n=1 Tax=Citrullus colocynthis TaxID=252529 RepID=A0ABP0Y6H6_9ROSI
MGPTEHKNYACLEAIWWDQHEIITVHLVKSWTDCEDPHVFTLLLSSVMFPAFIKDKIQDAQLLMPRAFQHEQSFVVAISADNQNLALGDVGAVFGWLSWSDGKHVVRSPLVVTQLEPL